MVGFGVKNDRRIIMKGRYKYYQPNRLDLKDEYGDCVIRALSKFFNLSWIDTFHKCLPIIEKYQMLPGQFFFAAQDDKINDELGIRRIPISNKRGSKRPTVESFAKSHPTGTYIVKVASHVVAVVDGYYYDTWDSGEKSLYAYFERI